MRSRICRRSNWLGRRVAVDAALALALLVAASGSALAHGSPDGGATLEGIPSWLYLLSGGSVVFLSFVLAGAFLARDADGFAYRSGTVDLDAGLLASVGRIGSVALYFGVVAAGLFGPTAALANPAPMFVEIYWWVSYGFFAVLVGNVWPVVNPWKVVFEWAGEPSLNLTYPEGLRELPAVLLFLLFCWLNMVAFAFSSPQLAGGLALGYGALMVVGMAAFGKHDWLHNADAFTRVFGLFGRFAPLELTDEGVEWRSYAVGLVEDAVDSREEVLLVIAVLFALTFDGFSETPPYRQLLAAFGTLKPVGLSPPLWNALFGGLVLLGGYAIFVLAYVLFAELMTRTAGADRPTDEVMARFALSLVPIAVAYHLAHYSLYYVLQHERIVAAAVRPFAAVEPNPDIIASLPTEAVWAYMVALIVGGHVASVWVAHHVSLDYFEARPAALRSQLPMLALMVFYTMASLWILSQPFGG